MPQARYTSDGDLFFIPDDVPANSLYPTNTEQQNNDLEQYTKSLPLPVDFGTHQEYKPTSGQKLISIITGGNGVDRYQFWPEKLVRSAVTLPHDVVTGNVDPGALRAPIISQTQSTDTEGELLERTQDLAGLAGGGGMPMAERGAVGIFGGRLAKTANLEKLKEAETLAAKGEYPHDIFEKTGWFQGVDGQWRFEIPDNAAKLAEGLPIGKSGNPSLDILNPTKLSNVINHPELMKAYPELATIPVRSTGLNYDLKGSFNPEIQSMQLKSMKPDEMLSTGLHEIQHYIQEYEKFAKGGNVEQFKPQDFDVMEKAFNIEQEKLKKRLKSVGIDNQFQAYNAVEYAQNKNRHSPYMDRFYNPTLEKLKGDKELFNDVKLAAEAFDGINIVKMRNFQKYRALAGEVEARNVQERQNLTPEERANIHPAYTQDIPNSEQIIQMPNGKSVKMTAVEGDPFKIINDRDGNLLTDYHGRPIQTDKDGMLTLYHRTNEKSKNEIYKTGKFKSKENTNETFFADNLDSEYGKGFSDHVVAIKIDPKYVRLNDQFPSGENHYAISNKFLNKSILLSDSGKAGAPLAALEHAPAFYSVLENTVKNAKMGKGSADQWLGYLKNNGVKTEELEHVLGSLPEGQITKQQLENIVSENKVQLNEIVKGNNKGKILTPDSPEFDASRIQRNPTKYQQWQLPGGENYRETLLTLPNRSEAQKLRMEADRRGYGDKISEWPDKEFAKRYREMVTNNPVSDTFTSSHWSEPNVLVHMRMNDRFIPSENGPSINQNLANPKGWHITPPSETVSGKWMVKSNDYNSKGFHFDTEAEAKANLAQNIAGERPGGPQIGDKGLKSLHIEEIQSDWHQKGRKEGYKLSKEQKDKLEPEFNRIDDKIVNSGDEAIMGNPDINEAIKLAVEKKIITPEEAKTYLRYSDSERVGAVPDAPFKSTWADLALKKVIREAAEKGYDSVSWTPGEAQAARYDLSTHVHKIEWEPSQAGQRNTLVKIRPKEGKEIRLQINNKGDIESGFPNSRTNQYEGRNLSDVIGKEHAERIINSNGTGEMEGEGLKIGGEGMKAFYDKMLVDKANALAKKFGGKVEQSNIENAGKYKFNVYDGEDNLLRTFDDRIDAQKFVAENPRTREIKEERVKGSQPIHILKLTPELKKQVLEKGFPLFSGSPILTPIDHDPFEKKQATIRLVPVVGNPFK